MAKRIKASAKASPSSRRATKKLSLYPLDFETALSAALQTGPPPKNKPVIEKKKKTLSNDS